MMSNPGIVSIHATTAANSLHYIFQASGDDLTRRLALLQAVGWQPLYRDRTKPPRPVEIDILKSAEQITVGDEAIGEIFATINDNRGKAAAKTLAYLGRGGSTEPALRRRPADDLPQGNGQPRLQVRSGDLGRVSGGRRAPVACPACRRGHVQSSGCENER